MSPALTGGFLSTESPGKSCFRLNEHLQSSVSHVEEVIWADFSGGNREAVHIWPKLANTFSNEKTWPRSQFAVLRCKKIAISSLFFFFFPNNAFNSHRAPEVLGVMSCSVEMWPWRGYSVVCHCGFVLMTNGWIWWLVTLSIFSCAFWPLVYLLGEGYSPFLCPLKKI